MKSKDKIAAAIFAVAVAVAFATKDEVAKVAADAAKVAKKSGEVAKKPRVWEIPTRPLRDSLDSKATTLTLTAEDFRGIKARLREYRTTTDGRNEKANVLDDETE